MKRERRWTRRLVVFVLALTLVTTGCLGTGAVFAGGKTQKTAAATPSKPLPKVSEKEIRAVFNQSVFVGNSVMNCKRKYFDKQGGRAKYGNPLFLAWWRYSCLADKKKFKRYMFSYKGKKMQAKTAIKLSGKKYVFISMGQNDLMGTVYDGYLNYAAYLKEIHRVNPRAVIFVEATTPMRHPRRKQTQARFDRFNEYTRAFCESKDWVWFIDTCTPLKGKDNLLIKAYSRDDYTHLNGKGSAAWTALDKQFIRTYLQYKKAGILKELEPVRKMPKMGRERQERTLVKKGKVMYYSDGVKVKGIVFYKGRFYVYPRKGKYSAKRSRRLNKAMKAKNLKLLRKLLGKPNSIDYIPSCWKEGGEDGIWTYNRGFYISTYRYPNGKEILIDVEQCSVVDYL